MIIWVITEGMAGTENQCLGVAEALVRRMGTGTISTKRVNLRLPYRLWSPFLSWGEGPGMLTATSDSIAPPWPNVVVAGGRKAVGIARYIRKVSAGRTLVCMVQDPKVRLNDFDLVAMPFHDLACRHGEGRGPKVTDGAPNRITPDLLDAAREKWRAALESLPAPRTAVLIGGTSKHHRMGAATMDRLIAHLKGAQASRGGSLMITVSRRTPEDLRARLEDAFSGTDAYLYTGTGDNPYHGFLAFADYIICTTDSTSMISDAATTGKPIEFFPLPGGSARHDRFIAHCRDLGVGVTGAAYAPWHDADRVAEVIEEMLKERPKG